MASDQNCTAARIMSGRFENVFKESSHARPSHRIHATGRTGGAIDSANAPLGGCGGCFACADGGGPEYRFGALASSMARTALWDFPSATPVRLLVLVSELLQVVFSISGFRLCQWSVDSAGLEESVLNGGAYEMLFKSKVSGVLFSIGVLLLISVPIASAVYTAINIELFEGVRYVLVGLFVVPYLVVVLSTYIRRNYKT